MNSKERWQSLVRHTLSEMPDESLLPAAQPATPVPALKVATFDELYAARRDLQAYKTDIVRNPIMDNEYHRTLEVFEATRIGGKTLFELLLEEKLAHVSGIVLSRNPFRCDIPPDTLHCILWYLEATTLRERARYLANVFTQEGVGEGDFIIVMNPVFVRSVPILGHYHVFIRDKPTYSETGLHRPFFDD